MAGSSPLGARAEALADDPIQRALSSPTRAAMYQRMRTLNTAVTAQAMAELFGVHTNVARDHLDQLAAAGLAIIGMRKNPRGGRPAKTYVARTQLLAENTAQVPEGTKLAVHSVVQLIAGLSEYRDKLALLAEEQGKRLVQAVAGRADTRSFTAATIVAMEGLTQAFSEVHAEPVDDGKVLIRGLDVALRLIGDVDGQIADAVITGFVRGAFFAAGAPVTVNSRSGVANVTLDDAGVGSLPSAERTLDVRHETFTRGVVQAKETIAMLTPGQHLEILTAGQGGPAAFAQWADREGHQVVDVARVLDTRGRTGVRILLRKATGR
ncbi:MAG: helix-turn-helix domain-containing protein [Nitriliruptoraceae bacterium]